MLTVLSVEWLVRIAVCAVLLQAGLAKLRTLGVFAETVHQVGLPRAAARPVAAAVATGEVAAAAGVVLAAGQRWPSALVAGMGLAFAAAGLRGLASPTRIRCACFGGGAGTLGRTQVLLAPVWLAAAAVALRGGDGGVGSADRMALLAWVVLALAAVTVARAVRAARVAHGYRLASEGSLAGKPDLFEGMSMTEVSR